MYMEVMRRPYHIARLSDIPTICKGIQNITYVADLAVEVDGSMLVLKTNHLRNSTSDFLSDFISMNFSML